MKAVIDYNRFGLPPKTANRNRPRQLAVFNNCLPKRLVFSSYKGLVVSSPTSNS
jgi:hypothetical protein